MPTKKQQVTSTLTPPPFTGDVEFITRVESIQWPARQGFCAHRGRMRFEKGILTVGPVEVQPPYEVQIPKP